MNHRTRHRIRPRGLAATAGAAGAAAAGAVAAITLLVAACSGGSAGTGASTASKSVPDTQQQAVAYSQCMQSHGDPGFPDPKQGPGGAWLYPETPQTQQYVSGPAFNAAQRSCKKLQPNQQLTPAERQAALAQLLKLSRCMRAHGITGFPDPVSNGQGVGIHIDDNDFDPSSPQFLAAAKSCHMPGRP
jgi:hypothetical protein